MERDSRYWWAMRASYTLWWIVLLYASSGIRGSYEVVARFFDSSANIPIICVSQELQAHTHVRLLDMVHHVVHLPEIQGVMHVMAIVGVTAPVTVMMTVAVMSTIHAMIIVSYV